MGITFKENKKMGDFPPGTTDLVVGLLGKVGLSERGEFVVRMWSYVKGTAHTQGIRVVSFSGYTVTVRVQPGDNKTARDLKITPPKVVAGDLSKGMTAEGLYNALKAAESQEEGVADTKADEQPAVAEEPTELSPADVLMRKYLQSAEEATRLREKAVSAKSQAEAISYGSEFAIAQGHVDAFSEGYNSAVSDVDRLEGEVAKLEEELRIARGRVDGARQRYGEAKRLFDSMAIQISELTAESERFSNLATEREKQAEELLRQHEAAEAEAQRLRPLADLVRGMTPEELMRVAKMAGIKFPLSVAEDK